jgi:hypothetical protein
LGVFQGFMQMGGAHSRSLALLPTTAVREEKCLLFSACHAPIARTPDAPCTTFPWLSFVDPPPIEGLCWYGSGVAATRGRRDLD